MRKLIILFFASILVVCLLAGCGGDDDDDDGVVGPGGPDGTGMGFSSMSPGDWAESRTPDGDRDISKFIGDDTWQGNACIVLEFESYFSGQSSVMQIWIDKATFEAVVLIIEMDGELVRMDPTASTDVPGEDEPWEMPTTQKVGTEKYTTPTGKTVTATIYRTQTDYGLSEDWVSSEVPFDLVKELVDGELVSSLYDFGTGADRSILKQEAENAEPFQIPTIPNDENPGDIPDDAADEPDNGNAEQEGQIVISVGDGARPEISVSMPVRILTISRAGMVWGFSVDDQAPALPGPFQYGVVPQGAVLIGLPNPVDLQAGQTYTIQVIGDVQGFIPLTGNIVFVR